MTATIDRPASASRVSPGRRPPMPSRPALRLPELALGVVLVAGSALGVLLWTTSSTRTEPVTVLARPVTRGQVVQEADLRAAGVRADGVAVLSWGAREQLVGRVALADLPAGLAVTTALVDEAPLLAADEALAALKVPPGALPAELAVGDEVDVVATPALGSDVAAGEAPTVLADRATVWALADAGDAEQSVVVTLRLPVEPARKVGAGSGLRLVRRGS